MKKKLRWGSGGKKIKLCVSIKKLVFSPTCLILTQELFNQKLHILICYKTNPRPSPCEPGNSISL